MVFPALNLRNNELIEFLSVNLLIFLCTYQKASHSDHPEKELLITSEKNNEGIVGKPT
jgi:hypothetical protein